MTTEWLASVLWRRGSVLLRGALLALLLVFAVQPFAAHAQDYFYTSDGSKITIVSYQGPGGEVTIPDTIDNLPVAIIGGSAFSDKTGVTSVTMGDNVTSVGLYTFSNCTGLTKVTIGNGITTIGDYAFTDCVALTSVTIGNQLTHIGTLAFYNCSGLTGVYFEGNAPGLGQTPFLFASNAVCYYLPDAEGWGGSLGGRPAVLWDPQVPVNAPQFGIEDDLFGFTITSASNLAVAVQASEDLDDPEWVNLGTVTLENGAAYFSDAKWTNFPSRFYRLRMP